MIWDVWMTLTFIQGHRCQKKKLEFVFLEKCHEVAKTFAIVGYGRKVTAKNTYVMSTMDHLRIRLSC